MSASGALLLGCCTPCPYCAERGQTTPSRYRVTIQNVSLCGCVDYQDGSGSHQWLVEPSVGPNGVWTLDRLVRTCGGSGLADGFVTPDEPRCVWRHWTDCSGTIRSYEATGCTGTYYDWDVTRWVVEVLLFRSDDGLGNLYYWHYVRGWWFGCSPYSPSEGRAIGAATWSGDPDEYVEADCGDVGPLSNERTNCTAPTSGVPIGYCPGPLAWGGTIEAEALYA